MISKAKISGATSDLKTPIAYTSVDARNFWPMPSGQKTQQHKQITSHDTINTAKRCFDLIVATVVTIFATPIMLCIAILVLLKDGRPIFFISERMKSPSTPFQLVKFRTMRGAPDSKMSGLQG
ncbi:UDP-glucose:undecaprenyl-phosphate glucose-1-phosphate transferase [Octadecabacter temperatus]|uniref:UDP-glucose:undecaprenyl-phosphate glucose-1-phosphate transferase n=1 Tax=Octadecabacter temperatus TaxID=1458307 RepID=A0A0K0Y9E3_9RHOB|nr:sugar transferase [Octadecabacter temperatus]AKS47578.1 UDP-glucose:undecaprenyl-phosphate glucose-1-phosphate transferase [Octadecabacter temperatus]